jgi:hypothetical protein
MSHILSNLVNEVSKWPHKMLRQLDFLAHGNFDKMEAARHWAPYAIDFAHSLVSGPLLAR